MSDYKIMISQGALYPSLW